MKKFQFLCANHHRWLIYNPQAATHIWSQSYNHSLDLVEECNYLEAINHAGAAFEASEIILDQEAPATAADIHRFADSGVLLARLLHSMREGSFASAVLASAIDRFEQLLILGVERKAVLAGCQRLLQVEENSTSVDKNAVQLSYSTAVSQEVH